MDQNLGLAEGQREGKDNDILNKEPEASTSDRHKASSAEKPVSQGFKQPITKLKLPSRSFDMGPPPNQALDQGDENNRSLSCHVGNVVDQTHLHSAPEAQIANIEELRDAAEMQARGLGMDGAETRNETNEDVSSYANLCDVPVDDYGGTEGLLDFFDRDLNVTKHDQIDLFGESLETGEMYADLIDNYDATTAYETYSGLDADSISMFQNVDEKLKDEHQGASRICKGSQSGIDVQSFAIGNTTSRQLSNTTPQKGFIGAEEGSQGEDSQEEEEEEQSNSGRSLDSCDAFETHEEDGSEEEEHVDEISDGTSILPLSSHKLWNQRHQSSGGSQEASGSFQLLQKRVSGLERGLRKQQEIQALPNAWKQDKTLLPQVTQMPHTTPNGQQEFVNMADICPNMPSMSFEPPTMPLADYRQSAQGDRPLTGTRSDPISFPYQSHNPFLFHPTSSNSMYLNPPLQNSGPLDQPSVPLTPDGWLKEFDTGLVPATKAHIPPASGHSNQIDGASEDDEPLRTRVKRHPSILGDGSVGPNSPTVRASTPPEKLEDQNQTVDLEPGDTMLDQTRTSGKNPVLLRRELPQAIIPSDVVSSPISLGDDIGSWALPKFEVQRQPLQNKDDVPSVKVSLPNLVREELLLSPDHAEQEVHLLLNLFIPGQQARAEPEPEPATAVLNFHTVAIMVVEAFVQFEIGDEMGLGPRHLRGFNDNSVDDESRMYDAKDANVDEIFFAVVDRWRAGLESKKQSLSLIRGAQEFCDVALDVIYYIKEHGLFKPEPKKRQTRVDKGTKRTPKQDKEATAKKETADNKGKGKKNATVAEDKSSAAKKGVKRPASQKVNVLQPRKKARTVNASKKPAASAKPKGKNSGVTVIKRK